MRVAWLECATGISGDMTLAALIDLGVDHDAIRTAIDSLQLPDVQLRIESVVKGGFRATQILVDHPEQHAHLHYSDILRILEASALTDRQRSTAQRIFLTIAEAEARVHAADIDTVHFHEVGAVDSIVDIVGAAVGFDLLGADQIVCHPVPTGGGFVTIDHGICPVPAPGTAEILRGVPLAEVPVEAELTTPTGAAIVKTLADRFGSLPPMTVQSIGCGAGLKTFPQRANILRIFVGDAAVDVSTDLVMLLETNLDDVTPETIGYVRDRLLHAGALDVYAVPVQMKKDRPGVILSVLANPPDVERFESVMFEETGTLGIRRQQLERTIQFRDIVTVSTLWGDVRGKRSWRTGRVARFTPEFDDCSRVAAECGIPLRDIYRAAESAFLESDDSRTMPSGQSSEISDDHHCDHAHDDHHHDRDHRH